MDVIKKIWLGVFHGFWDSIRGMTLILHIDEDIHRLNLAKEAERKQREQERQRRLQRSPSPTPSSASSMIRRNAGKSLAQDERENTDERTLDSLQRKPKSKEPEVAQGEKKIAKKVLKCCFLNSVFTWLSIVFFEHLFMPAIMLFVTMLYGEHSAELPLVLGWLQPILSIVFQMMWVLPIFLLSKIVSSLWFAEIANSAYRMRKGQPQMISVSKLVADFFFSVLVQALFLVQSMVVELLPIPYVGQALCILHLCLLYSLYSFEYKWFNMGWELHRRLSYIENNWPYFFGFGIPLTFLTSLGSTTIVSGCIFSIFFPLFILSGNEAKPIVKTTDTPLRLFSPVIFVSNLFFNRPKGTDRKQKMAQLQQQQQQQLLHAKSARSQQYREYEDSRYRQPVVRSDFRNASTPSPFRTNSSRSERYSHGTQPLVPTVVPVTPRKSDH